MMFSIASMFLVFCFAIMSLALCEERGLVWMPTIAASCGSAGLASERLSLVKVLAT
jgi:hypothetical protein